MNNRKIIPIIVLLTVLVTAVLYQPVSIAVFKLTEPYFGCPLKMPLKNVVIRNDAYGDGAFGSKRRGGRTHSGIDIKAPVGAPVCAAKSGIAFCGNVPTGYGKYVMIYHPDRTVTMYSHLSDWRVRSTQKVRKGTEIGLVGKTGNARNNNMEAHLHFEIRDGATPQDPGKLMR